METCINSHRSLLVATENQNKLVEVREILGRRVQLFSLKELAPKLSLPEEGINSYEENAAGKALYVGSETQVPTLGDDSGFEVSALDGKPGVLSARFAATKDASIQRKKILELVELHRDRACRFVCVLAFYDPASKKVMHFRGEANGTIAKEERGSFGFGYDSIVIPDGYSETFAELSTDVKNKISARALALEKFSDWFLGGNQYVTLS